MNRQYEFFFSVQFYQTCRIPDETKKILGPKINPPNSFIIAVTSTLPPPPTPASGRA